MSNPDVPAKIWYEANCHCGAIKYKVLAPSLSTQKVTNCNCSLCCKNGYLNIYPKRAEIVFDRGENNMKGYVYGVKECTHYFCPTCGSSLFVDPHVDDEMAANVRMFRDIDVDKLVLWKYDGFKVPPRYEV